MHRLLVPLDYSAHRLSVRESYINKVERFGFLPVLVPPTLSESARASLAAGCSGLLLLGGADVSPDLYGAEAHPATVCAPRERDLVEVQLVREFIARRLPILGICRGAQLLNVALGGTLEQHLPEVTEEAHRDALENPQENVIRCVHEVRLSPSSRVRELVQVDSLTVNSTHHQAVDRVGEGLRVSGRSPDGIVEFIELEGHPFCIGSQSHIECMDGPTDSLWREFARCVPLDSSLL